MKSYLKTLFIVLIFTNSYSQNLTFDPWNDLLNKYVNSTGEVNYSKLKKNTELINSCDSYFKNNQFNKNWTIQQKKSYWINLYNFYTIKLVISHFPLESIKDIKVQDKNAWEISFVPYSNKLISLNELENNFIRKESNDSRMHFLLNCASYSCPILLNKALNSINIEDELSIATKRFINDNNRNKLSANSIQISSIFLWYKDDFPNLIEFLQKYSKVKINNNAKISYLEYSWKLNKN